MPDPGDPDRFRLRRLSEGAAGGGTPVAICGAIMSASASILSRGCSMLDRQYFTGGLRGLGTPLIVLNGVTDLPTEKLSTMAGHQLPIPVADHSAVDGQVHVHLETDLAGLAALAVSGGRSRSFSTLLPPCTITSPAWFSIP